MRDGNQADEQAICQRTTGPGGKVHCTLRREMMHEGQGNIFGDELFQWISGIWPHIIVIFCIRGCLRVAPGIIQKLCSGLCKRRFKTGFGLRMYFEHS